MNRNAWAAGLAVIILAGCGSAPATHEPTTTAPAPRNAEEVRRALTDAMIQEGYCYRSDLKFCIRDPDFLDQVMTRLLGNTTLQALVTDQKEFRQLLREAPTSYTALQSTEDGLARLSRLTEENFTKPVITTTADVARADYGHIGAKMGRGGRGNIGISFGDSPHLDEHWQWKTTEVATALQALLDKYPDANAVEVRVLIPGGMQSDQWLYVYRHTLTGPRGIPMKEDRIHIILDGPPQKDYYTEPIHHDLGPYIRGEKSLSTRDLKSSGYR